jgi:riboflavin synthase
MFTGIIQHVGRVEAVTSTAGGMRLVVDPQGWTHEPKPGDSIANNGCCLTLVDPVGDHDGRFRFDVILETIDKTTLGAWKPGDQVNLERALRVGDTLDGHQVQGHVDGTGEVLAVETVDGYRIRIGLGEELMRYMVPKGSICIDGVSLTLAAMDTDAGWVEVALIPETLERTNLGDREAGHRVNIESDVMVKTIVHTMERMSLGGL